MRSEAQMFALIQSVAERDDRIRAVILNGSRANPNIPKDAFQDFDILYLVTELDHFRADPAWIDVFGERIILQLPNEMKIDENDFSSERPEITYLMLFKDTNRIDLKVIEVQRYLDFWGFQDHRDSLVRVLLDKDGVLDRSVESSERDYWITKPGQREFKDCCNEFWWVSTYVVKGVGRAQPLYAKDMLEGPVRKMFMRMMAWWVGTQSGFEINLGQSNRWLEQYIRPERWQQVMATYPNADLAEISKSLLVMADLFHEMAMIVGEQLGLVYNTIEAENVKAYLRGLFPV